MAASPPTKKRKASATASAASAASTASAPAAGRCALCAFGASTLDHLLTHVRESHKPADHPGLALDVGRMLIESALAGGALSGATSDWLAAVRVQFEAAAQLRTALARADAAAAAPLLLPLVTGREALAALQQAAQTLLEDDETGGRTSEHEEAAAEALTGLRRSTSTSSTTAATTATASAAASTAAVASAAAPFASFPSSAPLTITAPPPPLFPSPELFSPHRAGLATPGATPGASTLPSLFSRRVSLAPLTSPAAGGATPAAGPQVSSTAAGFVYGGLPPHPLGENAPEGSPTSLTPVFYRPFPTAGDQNAGSSATNRQSPVHQKRKSLAAKGPQPQQGAATPTSAGFQLPSGRAFQLQQMESGAGTPTGGAATPTTPTTPGGTTIPSAARKATPRRWTKEEDDALRAAVESHREKNWKAIAAQVPGRNHTQCLQRWTKVLAPGLVKGHWSPHEDELLRRLVATEQKNWGEVAAKIPGRTSKQCRERWHNHLDPNIVRGAYTPEEDRIILEAQARLGNRWSVIAAMLPGRTEDAVKIRWKSHCRVWRARKYLRKGGNAPDDDGGETPRTPLVQLVGGEFVWPTGAAPLPSPSAAADVKSEQLQQAQ